MVSAVDFAKKIFWMRIEMYLFVQSGSMLIRSLLPESCAIAAFETIEEM